MSSLESQQSKIKDLRSKILGSQQGSTETKLICEQQNLSNSNSFVASSMDERPVIKNQIEKYVNQLFHSSWTAQFDSTLMLDIQSVLNGGCVYLPAFFCEAKDFVLLQRLSTELEENAKKEQTNDNLIDDQGSQNSQGKVNVINWSKHLKMENPDFSPTFQEILDKMSNYFDVDIFATRLNFYRDGSDWKPYHHDSHAYSNGMKEDFTMGASFGFTRSLSFLHEPSGQHFEFPQQNGDIFAFDSEVNRKFKHGVPKMKTGSKAAPRFSIIAWGRRRTLNDRNSAASLRESKRNEQDENRCTFSLETNGNQNVESRNRSMSVSKNETNNGEESYERTEDKEDGKENQTVMDMSSVKKMVEDMTESGSSKSSNKDRNEKRGKKSRRAGGSRLQNRFDV